MSVQITIDVGCELAMPTLRERMEGLTKFLEEQSVRVDLGHVMEAIEAHERDSTQPIGEHKGWKMLKGGKLADLHLHACDICGFEWQHFKSHAAKLGADARERAHRCPNCGHRQRARENESATHAIVDGWQDERPTDYETYECALHPRVRDTFVPFIFDAWCGQSMIGCPHGTFSFRDLPPMFVGAKWKRREVSADPFASYSTSPIITDSAVPPARFAAVGAGRAHGPTGSMETGRWSTWPPYPASRRT